ncbi:MAG: NCS2 family permease [Lachnospiraceae bacterium]|nr:NCS2 family permease [Lachnospiraceae bacterium]
MLEKLFKLKANNTNVRTEFVAGITTFMTMAYILAVNPSILGDAGMDPNAVLIATCLASFIGTLCMAFLANLPFALSAGMGLNAYLAYTVVGSGVSWQMALFAVFIEGIIFIILSLTNVREAIFNAIPLTLKKGVSIGIGLFIAFIGLQNAGLCVDSATLVTITSFTENFNTKGICALLAIIGLLITAVLHIRKVKGAILLGIVLTWVLGILCQLVGIYVPDPAAGAYSLLPAGIISVDFSAFGNTFGQCFKIDFSGTDIFNFIVVVFAFLFVDLFDTLGTLIGVATKAKMLDENGRLPRIKPALLSDAIATSAGAVFGTSTTTTFVESSAGVAVGGRTGLTALTTGFLFLLSTLFSPLFTSIPSFATAPALIFVGFLMFESVVELKFDTENLAETIPAYLCIIAMPLFYSISEGICIGIISYVVLQVATGKAKKVKPLMYILAILFVLKYIFL